MDYFAGLDISMDETHVCVLDREGMVARESKTADSARTSSRQTDDLRRTAEISERVAHRTKLPRPRRSRAFCSDAAHRGLVVLFDPRGSCSRQVQLQSPNLLGSGVEETMIQRLIPSGVAAAIAGGTMAVALSCCPSFAPGGGRPAGLL